MTGQHSAGTPVRRERPLSPHLTIYKPQITSVLSITHRATGVFLLIGAFVFSAWLLAMAAGTPICDCMTDFFKGIIGKGFLFLWSAALYYHLFNGIRHLFWDMGKGFELKEAQYSGFLVVTLAIVFTVFTWVMVTGGSW